MSFKKIMNYYVFGVSDDEDTSKSEAQESKSEETQSQQLEQQPEPQSEQRHQGTNLGWWLEPGAHDDSANSSTLEPFQEQSKLMVPPKNTLKSGRIPDTIPQEAKKEGDSQRPTENLGFQNDLEEPDGSEATDEVKTVVEVSRAAEIDFTADMAEMAPGLIKDASSAATKQKMLGTLLSTVPQQKVSFDSFKNELMEKYVCFFKEKEPDNSKGSDQDQAEGSQGGGVGGGGNQTQQNADQQASPDSEENSKSEQENKIAKKPLNFLSPAEPSEDRGLRSYRLMAHYEPNKVSDAHLWWANDAVPAPNLLYKNSNTADPKDPNSISSVTQESQDGELGQNRYDDPQENKDIENPKAANEDAGLEYDSPEQGSDSPEQGSEAGDVLHMMKRTYASYDPDRVMHPEQWWASEEVFPAPTLLYGSTENPSENGKTPENAKDRSNEVADRSSVAGNNQRVQNSEEKVDSNEVSKKPNVEDAASRTIPPETNSTKYLEGSVQEGGQNFEEELNEENTSGNEPMADADEPTSSVGGENSPAGSAQQRSVDLASKGQVMSVSKDGDGYMRTERAEASYDPGRMNEAMYFWAEENLPHPKFYWRQQSRRESKSSKSGTQKSITAKKAHEWLVKESQLEMDDAETPLQGDENLPHPTLYWQQESGQDSESQKSESHKSITAQTAHQWLLEESRLIPDGEAQEDVPGAKENLPLQNVSNEVQGKVERADASYDPYKISDAHKWFANQENVEDEELPQMLDETMQVEGANQAPGQYFTEHSGKAFSETQKPEGVAGPSSGQQEQHENQQGSKGEAKQNVKQNVFESSMQTTSPKQEPVQERRESIRASVRVREVFKVKGSSIDGMHSKIHKSHNKK